MTRPCPTFEQLYNRAQRMLAKPVFGNRRHIAALALLEVEEQLEYAYQDHVAAYALAKALRYEDAVCFLFEAWPERDDRPKWVQNILEHELEARR